MEGNQAPPSGDGFVKPQVWGCGECARLGKTCCQDREILLTKGDIHRISRHTGKACEWEYRRPANPAYLDQADDPNWLKWGFRPDGTRPILKRQASGDCAYLTPKGCSLPMEIRPLVCRLYPYEYTEKGLAGVSTECPSSAVPPGKTILEVLEMHQVDAVRWHRILYTELRLGKPCDESGTDLRLAG